MRREWLFITCSVYHGPPDAPIWSQWQKCCAPALKRGLRHSWHYVGQNNLRLERTPHHYPCSTIYELLGKNTRLYLTDQFGDSQNIHWRLLEFARACFIRLVPARHRVCIGYCSTSQIAGQEPHTRFSFNGAP